MNEPISHSSAPLAYDQVAVRIIESRRARLQYFDSQFFGEHGWDLLLFLFSRHPGETTVQTAADGLGLSPSTITLMARLLTSHDLIESGDSTGGWHEIPLRLSQTGQSQVQAYIDHLAELAMRQRAA